MLKSHRWLVAPIQDSVSHRAGAALSHSGHLLEAKVVFSMQAQLPNKSLDLPSSQIAASRPVSFRSILPVSPLPRPALTQYHSSDYLSKRDTERQGTEGIYHTRVSWKCHVSSSLIIGEKAFRSCTLCKKKRKEEEFIKMQCRFKHYPENRYLGKNSCCQYRNN